MSNISGQLIKDSYNYVLQSDLITGVVYRISGNVVENPKFISGLTVNQSFTYSDGSEFPGYVLTCDALGNATWAPSSASTSGIFVTGGTLNYTTGTLKLVNSNGSQVTISGLTDTYVTGGTVSGTSIVFSYNDTNTFQVTGITPYNLFSSYTASTQPLILNAVTGGTFSGSTLYLFNNSGTTLQITGFSTSTSGGTVSGDYLPLSGGTVTGQTQFTAGLTANTISATTYQNLPISAVTSGNGISAYTNNGIVTISNTQVQGITGKTDGTGISSSISDNIITITNTLPDQTVIITGGTNIEVISNYPNFGINYTGTTGSNFTGGTVSGATNFTDGLTANTISATTYQNLPVSGFTEGSNISISGSDGNFTFSVTGITNPNTIYSSDDTLISNRTVSLDNYFIDFQSNAGNGFIYNIDRGLENFQVYRGGVGPIFDVSINNSTATVNGDFAMNSPTGSNYLFNIPTTPLDNTHKIVVNDPTFGFILGYDMSYISNSITGGTFSSNTLSLINNLGTIVDITGFTSGSGSFTGGTVSGETNFTGGLTANTINIVNTPTLNNTPTQILTRNTTTGEIQYTDPQQVKTVGNNLYLFYNY